jgi:multidrug efflux pump subunit AcrA (membrane-fusion protein)
VAQGAVVSKVLVEHGDKVQKGQPLMELFSPDLDKEHKRLIAELNASNTQMLNLRRQFDLATTKPQEREQINSQLSESRIKFQSAQEQLDIINEQLETLVLKAPCNGIVTTWEVEKNFMRRPVEVGQELIQVAETSGDWVLEVQVPDNDMGPILDAFEQLKRDIASGAKPAGSQLGAYFVTMTDPEHRYRGSVLRISAKAETAEQQHVVKITVAFPESVKTDFLRRVREMRPGTEVRARIECYNASLAYVLFRDVYQVFFETIMFRWPFLKN